MPLRRRRRLKQNDEKERRKKVHHSALMDTLARKIALLAVAYMYLRRPPALSPALSLFLSQLIIIPVVFYILGRLVRPKLDMVSLFIYPF